MPLSPRNHLREQIAEFAQAIQGTAEVEAGLNEAALNVAVLQAAVRSLSRGRPVEVDEVLAEVRNRPRG